MLLPGRRRGREGGGGAADGRLPAVRPELGRRLGQPGRPRTLDLRGSSLRVEEVRSS